MLDEMFQLKALNPVQAQWISLPAQQQLPLQGHKQGSLSLK